METSEQEAIRSACEAVSHAPERLLDVLRDVQERSHCVDDDAIDRIARELGIPRVEVEGAVSFYAFLGKERKGRTVIRLCDDVPDKMAGVDEVARALQDVLGIEMGGTTPDGAITLEWTPCIGMSDQAPAALVNDVVVTQLTTDKARHLARELRQHGDPQRLVRRLGDGANASELVRSMVQNNLRLRGPLIFDPWEPGRALERILGMRPLEVIRLIKTARLRGRGGAGFPAGMKWEFTRAAEGREKYVFCNADEGEPGTFKDRVILTECPDLLFDGMTVAGYAIGARHGILYLRAEYAYLRRHLEAVLERRRKQGLLGNELCGKQGCFDFDIRIQMGAGAYVCGEETALIRSCEGRRGDPKTRPPFPAQKGYLGCPTAVNNVETLCAVARIVDRGAAWFAQLGSKGSPGTKLLSISGDVLSPGVYEFPFGVRLGEVLKIAGAQNAQAVQVGGPSGRMVGREAFERTICYDDLATGGALIVFGPERDVLQIAREYLRFFAEESCGYCVPCRVGTVLLERKLDQILAGRGEPQDLPYLERLCDTMRTTSRCGLGQTASNPISSTLANFRERYLELLVEPHGELPSFDLDSQLSRARQIASTGGRS